MVTAAIPADATQAFIRLYNGSQSPSDVVWWDSLIMEEGTTDGSYFDGSTTGGAYSSYAWTGTPNASTSIAYP